MRHATGHDDEKQHRDRRRSQNCLVQGHRGKHPGRQPTAMNAKEEAKMPVSRLKSSVPHKRAENPALRKRREIPRFARNDGWVRGGKAREDGEVNSPLQNRSCAPGVSQGERAPENKLEKA